MEDYINADDNKTQWNKAFIAPSFTTLQPAKPIIILKADNMATYSAMTRECKCDWANFLILPPEVELVQVVAN